MILNDVLHEVEAVLVHIVNRRAGVDQVAQSNWHGRSGEGYRRDINVILEELGSFRHDSVVEGLDCEGICFIQGEFPGDEDQQVPKPRKVCPPDGVEARCFLADNGVRWAIFRSLP